MSELSISRASARFQFIGYILIGILAFLIDSGLLLILVSWGVAYLFANTISFLLANTVNFLIGHYIVFARQKPSRFLDSYLSVLSISLGGLLINNALLFVVFEYLWPHLLGSKVIATCCSFFWNFAARKYWVYA